MRPPSFWPSAALRPVRIPDAPCLPAWRRQTLLELPHGAIESESTHLRVSCERGVIERRAFQVSNGEVGFAERRQPVRVVIVRSPQRGDERVGEGLGGVRGGDGDAVLARPPQQRDQIDPMPIVFSRAGWIPDATVIADRFHEMIAQCFFQRDGIARGFDVVEVDLFMGPAEIAVNFRKRCLGQLGVLQRAFEQLDPSDDLICIDQTQSIMRGDLCRGEPRRGCG